MARGAKPGERRGGRKPGVPNRATIERQREVQASGVTPLEYILSVMRDKDAPKEMRLDAANKAAPYVHPKLSSIEHTGAGGDALIPPMVQFVIDADPS